VNINIKHVGFLAIVILIVSFALVGVSVNFVEGDQASNRVLNLAGKQRMLSQKIFKDIYKLDVYPDDRQNTISDIRVAYHELNRHVEIFEQEANHASAKLTQVYVAAGIFYFSVLALCFISGSILNSNLVCFGRNKCGCGKELRKRARLF